MELKNKKCVPCSSGVPPMTEEQARTLLEDIDPDWSLAPDASAISRRLKFKNFKKPMQLSMLFGEVAEQENHHPELSFSWGYLEVNITTHKTKGLTESDFILAAKLDHVYKDFSAT